MIGGGGQLKDLPLIGGDGQLKDLPLIGGGGQQKDLPLIGGDGQVKDLSSLIVRAAMCVCVCVRERFWSFLLCANGCIILLLSVPSVLARCTVMLSAV